LKIQGEKGMKWSNLNDKENGMKEAMIILAVEWVVFLLITFYLDQVVSSDNGIRKHPLFFLNFKRKGDTTSKGAPALTTARSRRFSGSRKSMAHIETEDLKAKGDRPDVAREVSPTLFTNFILSLFDSTILLPQLLFVSMNE